MSDRVYGYAIYVKSFRKNDDPDYVLNTSVEPAVGDLVLIGDSYYTIDERIHADHGLVLVAHKGVGGQIVR